MAGYTNFGDGNNTFWTPPESTTHTSYYEADYSNSQFQNQQLDFQTLEEYDQQKQYSSGYTQMYNPADFPAEQPMEDEDEPPLLEELEIYPDRILEKMLAVLNPLRAHSLADDAEYLRRDPDLAGPICFCIVLAVSLFLSGNNAHFGYIYGISVLSCVVMYALLTLMSVNNDIFSLTTVASILGYCLIPIVALSVLGVFVSMKTPLGVILAGVAVIWSSLSASRLFVALSGDKEQQPLIAYPCALVSGVYALLVLF